MSDSLADAVRALLADMGPLTVQAAPVDHHERLVWLVQSPGGPLVVKADVDPDRHRRERLALEAHRVSGQPVPLVLEQHTGTVNVLVISHRSGAPLDGRDDDDAWRLVGQATRALHLTPPTGEASFGAGAGPEERAGSLLAYAMGGETRRDDPLLAAGETLVRARLEETVSGVLIHGDCQPGHFLLGDDRRTVTGIIDFGDAGLGDPLWDLAVLTVDHPERLTAALAGYQPDPALAARAVHELPAYHALRCLTDIRWLREHDFDPGYCIERLEELVSG